MKELSFKEEFVARLVKLNVYDQFKSNCEAHFEKNHLSESMLERLNASISFSTFVLRAFVWNQTTEGIKFWDRISKS